MADGRSTRAVYLTDLPDRELPSEGYGRLYYGHEFCAQRLPPRRRVREMREAAAARGMAFTLVTPRFDEEDLDRIERLLEAVDPAADEIVVNDMGLFEVLRRRAWKGPLVMGRLLTKQRRGAAWKGPLPEEEGALRYLRGSSLDSPGFVELFVERFGVRRFELDNLIQGVEVGRLPEGVFLSVYHPWLFLTLTRHCPWRFDGRSWASGEGCPAPCRTDQLSLVPRDGGREIVMGSMAQFLLNEGAGVYDGPAVDRVVHMPGAPS
jgi:hypothetical protein